ncbi:MAG: response regulator [Verrucomicrobiota bacterium]
MKILAIDDNPDNLTVLKAVLLDRLPAAGLVSALNGPKGLDLAAAEDPDVILLDIVMPGMDGYDVCRKLKADEVLKSIPVLFLTAHTDRDSRIRAVEAGADGFLSKPIDELELTVQILAMTKLKSANRLQRLEKEELIALVAERTRELERELAERKQDAAINAFLATVRGNEINTSFFYALAGFLAGNLQMDFVCIDVLEGDGLMARTLAVWHDGKFEDNVTYALKDTPCGDVVGKEVCCFPANVCQFFPHDQVLQDLRAESYVGTTLFDHAGKPIGLIALISRNPLADRALAEVTLSRVSRVAAIELERLNAEAVLNNSEVLLRQSQEVAGMGSYSLNITTGKWVGSDVLNKVFGIDKGFDHSVEEWLALIHPDDRTMMGDYFREEVLGKGRPFHREYRVIRPADQAEIWVSGLGKLEFDPEGHPVRMFGTIQDITKRKQAEAELLTLRAAVEQSANMIEVTDPMGNIEYVNPAFEKGTGYSSAEAVGRNPRILKSSTQDATVYRNLWATILSGKIWRGEFHNRRKDGSLYWESATISPVLNSNGKIVHFIAIKENISERKEMEVRLSEALAHAEEGSRAKTEFLAIMSHELRTPLNGVLGFAELLVSTTSLDEEQNAYAKMIRKSGNHLLTIVQDILDFSSIENGALATRLGLESVAELVKASGETVWNSAKDKGISFQSVIEPAVPDQILGDGQRIRQILINLLGNAVKFTSSGSVTLCVAIVAEGGREFLDFSVADTGIGMSPDTIGIIFEPFTQADMKMNRTFGGTGLGLAISKRLAETMGGSLTVISTPGKGSTFTFRLPLKISDEGTAAVASPLLGAEIGSTSSPGAEASTAFENKLVLVVEDDPENSFLAGKMLQALGYRAEFAADGAEAVKAFKPGKFFAILMDIQMPVMNGLIATKKIREIETGARVPIIALTANVMPGNREQYLAANMDDFLSKPFKKDDLAAKLAAASRPL